MLLLCVVRSVFHCVCCVVVNGLCVVFYVWCVFLCAVCGVRVVSELFVRVLPCCVCWGRGVLNMLFVVCLACVACVVRAVRCVLMCACCGRRTCCMSCVLCVLRALWVLCI